MGKGADADERPDCVSEPIEDASVLVSSKGDCSDVCCECEAVCKTLKPAGSVLEHSSVYYSCADSVDPCTVSSVDEGKTRGCSDICPVLDVSLFT